MLYSNILTEDSKKMYPVYITLFSNDTETGKIIRKATGQDFSHATISLDPSLNNMYSFSSIPYNRGKFTNSFVRESLWSPMYLLNRYFLVSVTFVDAAGYVEMQKKIDYFAANQHKFKYNTPGLIQYYLNFKERKQYSEKTKLSWFCSEFVAYILKVGKGNVDDLMQSPGDLLELSDIHILKKYTLDTFTEEDLVKETEAYRRQSIKGLTEDYNDLELDMFALEENFIADKFKEVRTKWADVDMTKAVALMDWKKLYEEYHKLFVTDPIKRFNLFELIIRKKIIAAGMEVNNVTDIIVNELQVIHSKLKSLKASFQEAEVDEGIIVVDISSKKVDVKYPELVIK